MVLKITENIPIKDKGRKVGKKFNLNISKHILCVKLGAGVLGINR